MSLSIVNTWLATKMFQRNIFFYFNTIIYEGLPSNKLFKSSHLSPNCLSSKCLKWFPEFCAWMHPSERIQNCPSTRICTSLCARYLCERCTRRIFPKKVSIAKSNLVSVSVGFYTKLIMRFRPWEFNDVTLNMISGDWFWSEQNEGSSKCKTCLQIKWGPGGKWGGRCGGWWLFF